MYNDAKQHALQHVCCDGVQVLIEHRHDVELEDFELSQRKFLACNRAARPHKSASCDAVMTSYLVGNGPYVRLCISAQSASHSDYDPPWRRTLGALTTCQWSEHS